MHVREKEDESLKEKKQQKKNERKCSFSFLVSFLMFKKYKKRIKNLYEMSVYIVKHKIGRKKLKKKLEEDAKSELTRRKWKKEARM